MVTLVMDVNSDILRIVGRELISFNSIACERLNSTAQIEQHLHKYILGVEYVRTRLIVIVVVEAVVEICRRKRTATRPGIVRAGDTGLLLRRHDGSSNEQHRRGRPRGGRFYRGRGGERRPVEGGGGRTSVHPTPRDSRLLMAVSKYWGRSWGLMQVMLS